MCFNAARGFVGGAATMTSIEAAFHAAVSMPHAALWVVQQKLVGSIGMGTSVSMPHAALWVVQRLSP